MAAQRPNLNFLTNLSLVETLAKLIKGDFRIWQAGFSYTAGYLASLPAHPQPFQLDLQQSRQVHTRIQEALSRSIPSSSDGTQQLQASVVFVVPNPPAAYLYTSRSLHNSDISPVLAQTVATTVELLNTETQLTEFTLQQLWNNVGPFLTAGGMPEMGGGGPPVKSPTETWFEQIQKEINDEGKTLYASILEEKMRVAAEFKTARLQESVASRVVSLATVLDLEHYHGFDKSDLDKQLQSQCALLEAELLRGQKFKPQLLKKRANKRGLNFSDEKFEGLDQKFTKQNLNEATIRQLARNAGTIAGSFAAAAASGAAHNPVGVLNEASTIIESSVGPVKAFYDSDGAYTSSPSRFFTFNWVKNGSNIYAIVYSRSVKSKISQRYGTFGGSKKLTRKGYLFWGIGSIASADLRKMHFETETADHHNQNHDHQLGPGSSHDLHLPRGAIRNDLDHHGPPQVAITEDDDEESNHSSGGK